MVAGQGEDQQMIGGPTPGGAAGTSPRRGAVDASDILRLRPLGILDSDTCVGLRAHLGAAFAIGVDAVEIDLQDVSSIDETGLGVLAGAARHLCSRGGSLWLVHPSVRVLKSLRINELLHLVQVCPSPALLPPVAMPAPRGA